MRYISAAEGIMVIEHADFEGVERFFLVTGGEITSMVERQDLMELRRSRLGTTEVFYSPFICIQADRTVLQLIKFSSVTTGEACTVLRGSMNQMADEAERSLHGAQALRPLPGGERNKIHSRRRMLRNAHALWTRKHEEPRVRRGSRPRHSEAL